MIYVSGRSIFKLGKLNAITVKYYASLKNYCL